ncbi:hypothetical protein [Sphingomonas sp.]|uniref:hypothetical protein n=1 Tax=Sphingomonas sp. TaxID=28214 RepID=UPI0031E0A620
MDDIIALDIALRRNDDAWLEALLPSIRNQIDKMLYYGHFLCHQDYVLKPGVDPVMLKHEMWALLNARGARYPAEHNVGHLYPAGEPQAAHFRQLNPGNRLNPRIGHTSRNRCCPPLPFAALADRLHGIRADNAARSTSASAISTDGKVSSEG